MQLKDQEHYTIMEAFEKAYARSYRMDKEEKSLWHKGVIYQHPVANELFLAFRQGVSFGRNLYQYL